MSVAQFEKHSLTNLRTTLLDLPRYYKRTVLVFLDFLALTAILWTVMSVRYGALYWPESWIVWLTLLAAPAITITTFAYAGLYRLVTRYLGPHGHTRIVACVDHVVARLGLCPAVEIIPHVAPVAAGRGL